MTNNYSKRGLINYKGLTITVVNDEAGFGQMDGYDLTASAKKYGELLTSALEDQFPYAEVNVSFDSRKWNGGETTVVVDDAFDGDTVEEIEARVESIASQVFEHEDWAVAYDDAEA